MMQNFLTVEGNRKSELSRARALQSTWRYIEEYRHACVHRHELTQVHTHSRCTHTGTHTHTFSFCQNVDNNRIKNHSIHTSINRRIFYIKYFGSYWKIELDGFWIWIFILCFIRHFQLYAICMSFFETHLSQWVICKCKIIYQK